MREETPSDTKATTHHLP